MRLASDVQIELKPPATVNSESEKAVISGSLLTVSLRLGFLLEGSVGLNSP